MPVLAGVLSYLPYHMVYFEGLLSCSRNCLLGKNICRGLVSAKLLGNRTQVFMFGIIRSPCYLNLSLPVHITNRRWCPLLPPGWFNRRWNPVCKDQFCSSVPFFHKWFHQTTSQTTASPLFFLSTLQQASFGSVELVDRWRAHRRNGYSINVLVMVENQIVQMK